MTLEETLKEMRKPFDKRDLAAINEVVTPEVYEIITGSKLPKDVFIVGFGNEVGLGLGFGDNFDELGDGDFDYCGCDSCAIYYCRNSFATEQGWLKKRRKPWSLEALRKKGYPVAIELNSGELVPASFNTNELWFASVQLNGIIYTYSELSLFSVPVKKIILADGTSLPPYNEE